MTKKKTTRTTSKRKQPEPLEVGDVQECISEIYRQAVADNHKPAIDGLCAILDQAALLVAMAADRTKRLEFSRQVAVSSSTLTRTLEEITKSRSQQIKGVAGRLHHWPVLVDANGNMRDDDLAVKVRSLGLGREFPFRNTLNFKQDYFQALKIIFTGAVENYETKSVWVLSPSPEVERWTKQNPDEATAAMTDYAIRAFDVLFDGKKRWDIETFKRRFPIRSWVDGDECILTRPTVKDHTMGIRGAVRGALTKAIKRLFVASSK